MWLSKKGTWKRGIVYKWNWFQVDMAQKILKAFFVLGLVKLHEKTFSHLSEDNHNKRYFQWQEK